jgi:hypothetical protein
VAVLLRLGGDGAAAGHGWRRRRRVALGPPTRRLQDHPGLRECYGDSGGAGLYVCTIAAPSSGPFQKGAIQIVLRSLRPSPMGWFR